MKVFLIILLPKKDTFLLANLKDIVSTIQSQLDRNKNPKLKKYLEFNLKYFTNLRNSGKEYLVLDGQHRIEEIVNYAAFPMMLKPKMADFYH